MSSSDQVLQLRLGDCIEVLKNIPEGSVGAIVTDPPCQRFRAARTALSGSSRKSISQISMRGM